MDFQATDRPSPQFFDVFKQGLRALPSETLGLDTTLTLSTCGETPLGALLAEIGPTERFAVLGIDGRQGVIGIPDATLDALVDLAFGGDARDAGPRPPTPLGARLGDRIAAMLAQALAANTPHSAVRLVGATSAPAVVVPDDAPAFACAFSIAARGRALGSIGVCLPLAALAGAENAAAQAIEDADWADRLETACGAIRLQVRCVLARPELTAGEIAGLAPGVVIPIPALGEVALIAGGYRIASGSADVHDERAVIVINKTEFHS